MDRRVQLTAVEAVRRAQPASRTIAVWRRCLKIAAALCLALCLEAFAAAQAPAPAPAAPADDYSGMYTFLQDGEFVQISVEDDGTVTGFVSRYGESDSDRGAFLDQFFKTGRLDGRKLSFITRTVHGVWYQFTGAVGRGDGKTINDVGYYVLKGTLIQNTSDVNKKTSAKMRSVVFQSFPRDVESDSGSPPSSSK